MVDAGVPTNIEHRHGGFALDKALIGACGKQDIEVDVLKSLINLGANINA